MNFEKDTRIFLKTAHMDEWQKLITPAQMLDGNDQRDGKT